MPCENGALPDLDAAAMQAFRVADVQVGGGNLYPSVINYLNSAVAPRLFGSDGGQSSTQRAFEAAAALTEMAGWMAHDAGSDVVAGRHFERSLALAEVSRDGQLNAHVLGSMSHLAGHLNQPDEAIAYAQQGQVVLSSGPASPGLKARLFALEARGFAVKADAGKCSKFLIVNLQPLLVPYCTTDAVAEFLSCLNEALMERQWLYRWLRVGIA